MARGFWGWFIEVNYLVIARRVIITAFVFFLLGGVEALLMRLQLARPNPRCVGPDLYNQLFTTHGSTMMFLFAVPVMQGMALYLVPLMVGTRSVAFPRLNAYSYYICLISRSRTVARRARAWVVAWQMLRHPLMHDLLCFSHLQWDLVFQRPQHLLTRCAKEGRVFYIEEPRFGADEPNLEVRQDRSGVQVVVVHLPNGLTEHEALSCQRLYLQELFAKQAIFDHVQWFYTPMALPLAEGLPEPLACVYDCMDELTAFKGAHGNLRAFEQKLLARADVVFTGGHALYEAKQHLHHNIHPFPSSVDRAHFGQARRPQADPPDQASIPHPRLGFFGVVDERMDIDLLRSVALARPDWQIVIIGPVVKVDPSELPHAPNIHYLGAKPYADLPRYIAGWDVALMPFAKNESTRFISPTKTPEYLAAGKPVVSTSIRDVVRPYSVQGLARIADTPEDFVAACQACLSEAPERRRQRADAFLAHLSWDQTWEDMREHLRQAIEGTGRDSGQRVAVARNDLSREAG